MIITRTPFRVSFLGGGTDIPWFYEENGGCVISTAIDKYMYLSAHPLFESESTLLKYSKTERVDNLERIEHPIFREVLKRYQTQGLDISVSADFPAGTGLGSSSSFTVGLVNLLKSHKGEFASKQYLAETACDIELVRLSEPIGKQDQYAAAFGGLNFIDFQTNGSVAVSPIVLNEESSRWLSEAMVLVWIGSAPRSASEMLRSQAKAATESRDVKQALIELAEVTRQSRSRIQQDISELGALLKSSWELKKRSNPAGVTEVIDELVEFGISKGALGAKLLGAGGSGFVLFLVEPTQVERFIQDVGPSRSHQVRVDNIGSTVIYAK